ncbi:Sensor protein ZraS [Symmachiella dynata]|uniref:sensor histidine kinase n=1 Tax=Symmachiella dynata TaxID=2527995 RepID=UPI001188B55D|nr:ATP-binding protein [Symmachiella dynata]QDT48484.1 Sensor protein ZraS [Symmachiella dynata]
MLFTRTIRRKLLLGLGLVLTMLLMASFSGIWGLSSYAELIGELEFNLQQTPNKTALVKAAGALYKPLVDRPNPHADPTLVNKIRRSQLEIFCYRTDAAHTAYRDFQVKLEEIPLTSVLESQFLILNNSLHAFNNKLTELEHQAKTALNGKVIDEVAMDQLLKGTWELEQIAQTMLDPANGLHAALDQAQRDYESTSTLLWTTTAVAVVLFLGLIRHSYVQIFRPLRQLYEGARRVAQGCFDYRIPISTHDEMGELAESFNMMTTRFQDIAGDLDQQVNERSRQLIRSERLAAVGFLSAGVAHEINNPLAAIAMASESVEDRIEDLLHVQNEPSGDAKIIRDYLQMIQKESFRCREITTKLLDFSRGSESTRESTDVTGLIREVIAMVQHLSKYRDMQITFRAATPSYLEANPAEIKQVLLNLVANGLESMEAGGTLSITIEERTDEVRIVFQDEGCGMTPAVIENLFEPFFTSKRVGQGTGLGLSISHRIINDHGGTIEAHSDGVGQGSRFCISLPRRAMNAIAA